MGEEKAIVVSENPRNLESEEDFKSAVSKIKQTINKQTNK